MSVIPTSCPKCNSSAKWEKSDVSRQGFGVGKAALGGIVFGPIGLVAGAIGKNKIEYHCSNCGYTNEYSKLGVSSNTVADTVKKIVD